MGRLEAMTPDAVAPEKPTVKERCVCGKWWGLRTGKGEVVLRCKRCKREIVVRAEGDRLTHTSRL